MAALYRKYRPQTFAEVLGQKYLVRTLKSQVAGGLLGGFFLGILWRRAVQRDAILGMSIGILAMSVVVFARQFIAAFPSLANALTPIAGIAWPWYVLIGTSITFGVGAISSLTHASRTGSATG